MLEVRPLHQQRTPYKNGGSVEGRLLQQLGIIPVVEVGKKLTQWLERPVPHHGRQRHDYFPQIVPHAFATHQHYDSGDTLAPTDLPAGRAFPSLDDHAIERSV
jgi:hypothetical protein